jgi:hypothetical protein
MSIRAWERCVDRGRWWLLASMGVAASLTVACGDDGQAASPETDAGAVDSGLDVEEPDVGESEGGTEGGTETGNGGWTSMCNYDDGSAIPYDHARGLVEEYTYELAMSCELGGFVAPLVEADPVEFTEVFAFNEALTDWYRARILGCGDASPPSDDGAFLLVPPSQAAGMSKGDFESVVALFSSILDRHEGMPDALSLEAREEVKTRLQTFEETAVEQETMEFTKPSGAPECAQDDG